MTPPETPDRDRVSTLQPPPTDHRPGVAGNERLTALTAAILLPLIVAEIATIANIRALMSTHVLVGVLLAGPLTVKTASTGWRLRHLTASGVRGDQLLRDTQSHLHPFPTTRSMTGRGAIT